jgi:DNA-binding NtrC family response regulator
MTRAFSGRQLSEDRNGSEVESCASQSIPTNLHNATTSGALSVTTDDCSASVNLKAAKRAIEVDFIKRALFHNKGVISRAAKDLGISRVSLYDLIQRHKFELRHFKQVNEKS